MARENTGATTVHYMRLQPGPFNAIQKGEKSYEFRLNDQKRRFIRVGDTIVFSKMPELFDEITVEVTSLNHRMSFDDLYEVIKESYPRLTRPRFVGDLRKYYTRSDEDKYGVLAIGIRLRKKS